MDRLPHFLIQSTAQKYRYVSPSKGGGEFNNPARDRVTHGTKLAESLKQIEIEVQNETEKPATGVSFVPIVVSSDPEFELKLGSLDNKTLGMKIINVRHEDNGSQVATIHIPVDKFSKFSKKIEDYTQKDTSKNGNPPNQELVESINQIRLAKLQSGDYWTDSGPMPSADEVFWWEVWLRNDVEPSSYSVEERFRTEATALGIRVSKEKTEFPEFVILLAYTSLNVFIEFPGLLRYLAELRRASLISPREFLNLSPAGQNEYINAMLERITFAPDSAPSVCLLDGGVNRGHPLLQQALSQKHNIAWNDDWTSAGRDGHGTEMAGLALFGDKLNELLYENDKILLEHGLEAVKIIPDKGENDPPDYGPITAGSVAKMEVESQKRFRVICMAVTAGDKERWLPTLWSATIDQLCSGAMDNQRRLMIVSAGNYSSPELLAENYPQINRDSSVEDPAQAWNIVTVGANTEKVMITDSDLTGYTPLAKSGALSPRSRTSFSWEDQAWPIKPDIVMEGGNYAASPDGRVWDVDDLSLLTTGLSSNGKLLTSIRDTSAATALAARFAALIAAEYPNLWPETIRGLMIHSASWTQAMHEEFPKKKDRLNLLRCYGYGVPNLEVARQCASNRATLILQETLQPFCWNKSKPATNEMNIHELPWPVQWLQELGELQLRMRVTLSYFIEPSPGRLGWDLKHRYQSHGLRFDVKRPEESAKQFRERLTEAVWENNTKETETIKESREWVLGPTKRTKGTIHSDWWSGTAAKLAASGHIAIYPVKGWWCERPNQKAFDKQARYSLIITLESEDKDVPIYNEVATSIKNWNTISVAT